MVDVFVRDDASHLIPVQQDLREPNGLRHGDVREIEDLMAHGLPTPRDRGSNWVCRQRCLLNALWLGRFCGILGRICGTNRIRARKACPERSEGRRLSEDASPEGLIASFRTGVVAEPALLG